MGKWKYLFAAAVIAGVFLLGIWIGSNKEDNAVVLPKAIGASGGSIEEEKALEGPEVKQEHKKDMDGKMEKYAADMHKSIAEKLGITWDELREVMSGGKSIAEIAGDKGVRVDTLVSELIQLNKKQFEGLVKNGEITQEESDEMLPVMESMIMSIIEQGSEGSMDGIDDSI